MIGGGDLGESFGLGAVGLVATGADDGGVELARLHGGGVIGVFGLSSVAGFAGDYDVAAELFLIDHVCMAALAYVVACEGCGAGGDLGNGSTTIVAVLAEAVGDDKGAQGDERNQSDGHHCREPDEVLNILEQVVRRSLGASCAQQSAMLLDT